MKWLIFFFFFISPVMAICLLAGLCIQRAVTHHTLQQSRQAGRQPAICQGTHQCVSTAGSAVPGAGSSSLVPGQPWHSKAGVLGGNIMCWCWEALNRSVGGNDGRGGQKRFHKSCFQLQSHSVSEAIHFSFLSFLENTEIHYAIK